MPALSFSGTPKRGPFYELVQKGEKTVTTRKLRKHPIKPGDNLVLYWKQRTPIKNKPVHKIGDATCIRSLTYASMKALLLSLRVTGILSYIKQEGFDNLGELVEWWTGEKASSYGIMNGGVLLDSDSWDVLEATGPVQVIEFILNSQGERKQ